MAAGETKPRALRTSLSLSLPGRLRPPNLRGERGVGSGADVVLWIKVSGSWFSSVVSTR